MFFFLEIQVATLPDSGKILTNSSIFYQVWQIQPESGSIRQNLPDLVGHLNFQTLTLPFCTRDTEKQLIMLLYISLR